MNVEVSFTDFRGFRSQSYVPIKPLTILVGENSAGKTSFLAAIKYLGDLVSRTTTVDFNSEPFHLGTFEQIAHNRGGRAGRAKKISLSVRKRLTPGRRGRYVNIRLDFTQQEIGASLSLIELNAHGVKLIVRQQEGNISAVASKEPERLEWAIDQNLLDIFSGRLENSVGFILSNLRMLLGASAKDDAKVLDDFISASENLLEDLKKPQSATSAIRTKPLRTYTPSVDSEDGEGSHVPYEMAKLARRRDKESWNTLKEKLEIFGRNSEMFSEIDVKSFGNTLSDPFQIQLSLSGPKRNIVDLGYGTSQVLPILYSVLSDENGKTFLIQQPEVHLHPKAQAALGQFFIDSIKLSSQRFILETHSDFILDRARMAIANHDLGQEDVSILFFSRDRLDNSIRPIHLDERGDPSDPPQSYRSFFVDEQLRLLGVDGL